MEVFRDPEYIPSGLQLLHTLTGHKARIGHIAWSPDGRLIASPSDDRSVRVWDGETGHIRKVLKGHLTEVSSVSWSPDSSKLVTGARDKIVRLWNLRSGQIINAFHGHDALVRSVAWAPNNEWIVSSSDDHTVRVWSLETQSIHKIIELDDRLPCIAWAPNSAFLAVASDSGDVFLLDTLSWSTIHKFTGHSSCVLHLSWSSDGERLASASADRTISIWNLSKEPHRKRMGLFQ